MKTKMLTALIASIVLAALACPVLAVTVDRLVAGLPLDASAIPTTFDAGTVLGWWLSGTFALCPAGTALTLLLSLCTCTLLAWSSALNDRAEDGGVLGEAHV